MSVLCPDSAAIFVALAWMQDNARTARRSHVSKQRDEPNVYVLFKAR